MKLTRGQRTMLWGLVVGGTVFGVVFFFGRKIMQIPEIEPGRILWEGPDV